MHLIIWRRTNSPSWRRALTEVPRGPLTPTVPDLLRNNRSGGGAASGGIDYLEKDVESETFLHSLFCFYYRPIYYLFLRQGFSPHDSDDLAQETFLRICRGIKSFRHDCSLEAWIFKIALNVVRRRLRYSRAAKRRGEVVSLDSRHDPSEVPL